MTTKEHIDEAIRNLITLRRANEGTPAREFSIAITALEDAKMRTTRGLAMAHGVFNEVDLEKDAGIQRAKSNFIRNVACNEDGGIARS